MAMVLVQQPTARTAPFRERLAKVAANKHEETMGRCATGSLPHSLYSCRVWSVIGYMHGGWVVTCNISHPRVFVHTTACLIQPG